VNTPYIYVGSWKTMFGWHKEDMDLYSINYLHQGKPKFWYGVDLDCNEKFETFVKSKFPDYFKECPEFIRHKTTLIYPGLLLENGIKLHKMVHEEGEYMISRASAYHSGFN
jgi:jumonji domain-containing protein 2